MPRASRTSLRCVAEAACGCARWDGFTEHHLPRLEQEPGYCGVWAGIDYTGGCAIAVTYWESNDALHASDALANEVRAAAVAKAAVDRNRPPITDRYEVVLERYPPNGWIALSREKIASGPRQTR
jgi:hypothetical protein